MDSDAERRCKSCHGCQLVGQLNVPEPMKRTEPPSGPWQDVGFDLETNADRGRFACRSGLLQSLL